MSSFVLAVRAKLEDLAVGGTGFPPTVVVDQYTADLPDRVEFVGTFLTASPLGERPSCRGDSRVRTPIPWPLAAHLVLEIRV